MNDTHSDLLILEVIFRWLHHLALLKIVTKLSMSVIYWDHLGEFPIVSYLKVTDSTKSGVTFLVLVRGFFFLYHLKAYVYSFILTRDS